MTVATFLNVREVERRGAMLGDKLYLRIANVPQLTFVALIEDLDGSVIAPVLDSDELYPACCLTVEQGLHKQREMRIFALNPDTIPELESDNLLGGPYGHEIIKDLERAAGYVP